MADFEKLYYFMFNAVTDALELIDAKEYGSAREELKKAQLKAEALYISSDEEDNPTYELKIIK